MAYQQKLLYIASLIVVGTAILVGIQKFQSSSRDANINALTLDLLDIATKIQADYFTPQCLGGGDHSFSGVATFKNAKTVKEAIINTPLNKILIETDSPYLAPTPYRGKRNEPSYVVEVAKEIARLKKISLEEVAQITTENAKKVYNIV